ncbi:MAG: phosphatidylserine decarboxylase family protein [Bacteroidales bacterium]|nr:phosphatidylserine decarboxylase family protein [Lentimicrobiaceae bacterium]MBQ2852602.1 phosphatidylserine decarboxylase family protein [Bacteroidales bacterium]
MYIHKKGYGVITTVVIITAIIATAAFLFIPLTWIKIPVAALCLAIAFWSFTFFRVPTNRKTTIEDNAVVSAADGEVVVIEEVEETEYFHDKRIQISIFMSAYNVHVNWFPINGVVSYYKYHPGKKLFAINPKSSELNERNTLVVKDEQGREVLFRQIAGVMARRIICHVDKGADAKVGEEFGLIRFGSRVDFFLPLDSKINVKIGDKVKGKISTLAYLR